VVVTGVSGSGKSSLVFDTLYAEGQRRYVETFSPYARQFLDRMDKPAWTAVDGIPPAIAIDQTNPVRTSRSTVGTMTELNDHLKLLFARTATCTAGTAASPCAATPPSERFKTTRLSSARRGGRSARLHLLSRSRCRRIFKEAESPQAARIAGYTRCRNAWATRSRWCRTACGSGNAGSVRESWIAGDGRLARRSRTREPARGGRQPFAH
jgi:excinuclease ABC subunit A